MKRLNKHNILEDLNDDTIKLYYKNLSKIKLLSRKEEDYYLSIYYDKTINEDKRIEARNKVIMNNLRFAFKIASSFMGKGIPLSSLISEANDGLIHSFDNFDISKGLKFSTYANYWIRQRLIEIVKNAKKNNTNSEDNEEEIESDNSNKYEEVNYDTLSDVHIMVNELFSSLNPKEADIISMRYGFGVYNEEQPLKIIAKKYNISAEAIRQIIDRATLKMKCYALENEDKF